MEPDVVALAERLAAVIRGTCPLVGAYVHGSAALGGFVAGLSDVDLLFVVEHEVADAPRLGERLTEASTPCPGRGVELSIVTREQAAAPGDPWPFVLHVSTAPGEAKVVDGGASDGDRDLLMHYAVARAAGEVIDGPPPREVFADPGRRAVLAYLVEELEWAATTPGVTEAYAVLNACRAWQFVETGELVSKLTGGAWAKEQGAPVRLVGRALGAQLGLVEHRPLGDDGREFVGSVRDRVREAD